MTIVVAAAIGPGAFGIAGAGLGTTVASGLGFSTAAGTFGSALATGVNAFATSALVGSIDGAVSGNFDLGEILKNAAFAGVTAGLVKGINLQTFGVNSSAGVLGENIISGFGNGQFTLGKLLEGTLDAGIRQGLSSAVYGTDFGEGFIENITSVFVNAVASAAIFEVSEHTGHHNFSVEKLVAKAAISCLAAEATGADCHAGAIGSLVTDVVVASGGSLGAQDTEQYKENLKIIAAAVGYITSGGKAENVNETANAAITDLENNALCAGACVALIIAGTVALLKVADAALTAKDAYDLGTAAYNCDAGSQAACTEMKDRLKSAGIDVALNIIPGGKVGSKLLGLVGKKFGNKIENAIDTAYDAARKTCSFHGDTQVLTRSGYHAIKDLKVGMSVWARDDKNGQMAWKSIQAHYSNPYDETVHVTIRDVDTGEEQTIVSNKIHPFFVQVPQAQNLLHLASTGTGNAVPISSEGHHYQGVIEGGHWVDAADLKAGYRLLNNDESWAEVVKVRVDNNPLKAYNLTVEEFHTYFVRGADNDNAVPVWVHNDCVSSINWKGFNKKTHEIDGKKLTNAQHHFNKHGAEFGAKNPQDYINKAKAFSKLETGNGIVAHTVGNYKIKVDTVNGVAFIGGKNRSIHTFYKNDGRRPNSEFLDYVLNEAKNKSY